MGRSVFELGVRVTASGKQVLTNLQNEQRKTARAAAENTAKWNEGLKQAGLIAAGLVGTLYTLKKAMDFGKQGEQIHNIGVAFRALNPQAEATLMTLEKGFRRTLDVTSQQQIANQLATMKVGMADMGRVADLAFRAYTARGGDAVAVAKAFTTAVATGRTQTLAQYGILVDLKTVYADYAADINVAVRALTDQQKKQALLNAIMEQGAEAYKALPMEEMTLATHQLSKQVSDLWSDFNELAGGAMAAVVDKGGDVALVMEAMFRPEAAARREEAIWQLEQLSEGVRLAGELEKELHAIVEESRAKMRENTLVLDENGKELAKRIFTQDAYLTQMSRILALEEQRKEGLYGLTKAEETELASLKASTEEFGRRNLSLATAVDFEVKLDQARKDSKTTLGAMLNSLASLEGALQKTVDVEAPERAEEHEKELTALLGTLRDLEETGSVWTDELKEMTTETLAALEAVRELRLVFTDQDRAVAAATDTMDEWADTQATINGILRDPTPQEKLKQLYDEMARSGPTAVLLKQLKQALLDVYAISGQVSTSEGGLLMDLTPGGVDEMQQTFNEMVKRARAAYSSRTTTAKQAVKDISDAEFSLRRDILQETDEFNREVLEADLVRMKAEEQFAEKRIGTKALELAFLRADEMERKALADKNEEREKAHTAIIVDLAKVREDAKKKLAETEAEQDRLGAELHRQKMDRWREEDQRIRDRVSQLESVFTAMGMMGSDFGTMMGQAMRPAQDALMSFTEASRTSGEAQTRALSSGISASGAAASAFIKDTKKQALVRGLFEQAAAFASLARYDYVGAAFHQLAAGTFFGVAGSGGGRGKGTSGYQGRGYEAPRAAIGGSTGGGGGGTTIINNMHGFAVGSLEDLGRWQAKALNAVAGESTLDPRIIGAAAGGV